MDKTQTCKILIGFFPEKKIVSPCRECQFSFKFFNPTRFTVDFTMNPPLEFSKISHFFP